jgi:hypothetical protein
LLDNGGTHTVASGTLQYRVNGFVGCIYGTANILGTSTATDLTMTGLPTVLQTPNTQQGICLLENNNAPVIGWFATNNTGTVAFSTLQTQAAGAGSDLVSNTSGFTAAGTKGLVVATVMVFSLV